MTDRWGDIELPDLGRRSISALLTLAHAYRNRRKNCEHQNYRSLLRYYCRGREENPCVVWPGCRKDSYWKKIIGAVDAVKQAIFLGNANSVRRCVVGPRRRSNIDPHTKLRNKS